MTYETYKTVLQALANGHPCNTSNDYAVSVRSYTWQGVEHYYLTIFPSEHFQFWTEVPMRAFMALAEVYDLHFSVSANHGVVTAYFS